MISSRVQSGRSRFSTVNPSICSRWATVLSPPLKSPGPSGTPVLTPCAYPTIALESYSLPSCCRKYARAGPNPVDFKNASRPRRSNSSTAARTPVRVTSLRVTTGMYDLPPTERVPSQAARSNNFASRQSVRRVQQ